MASSFIRSLAPLALIAALPAAALAQAPATPPAGAAARPMPPPRPASPVVAADGAVTFRLRAPEAKAVIMRGEFLGQGKTLALSKGDDGVWSGVTEPLPAGAYRYTFNVDGVTTLDAANTATSAARDNIQSVVFVPGQPMEANAPATPHGSVAQVWYPSKFGGGQRRMHVYTPPGYEKGTASYPVLYLIHGGGDGDNSWSTVGRAGFILDNLIASGKAKPMIVVMPDGNVGPNGQVMTGDPANEPFVSDLVDSIVPFVEKTYRASAKADDRALAGLSMGGIQTMNAGLTHPKMFHYIGVFSSGFFPADLTVYEAKAGPQLDAAKADVKLLYIAYGETDIAKPQAETNIAMLKAHGLSPVVEVTDRGHEWYNWRRYLVSFAPRLFR